MKMSPTVERYILHWGEMGTRWGVNRSVAQIHALLYLAPDPLTAEEIAETLGIARSNVSTSLKELQSWNLAQLTHVLGDRRDHFVTHKDPWDLLTVIVEGRKRREIDPTLTMLRQSVLDAEEDRETDSRVKARIKEMLDFLEGLSESYEQLRRLPPKKLHALVRMGDKLAKLLPGK